MILMNNFKAEPEELKVAEAKAAERVIRSGWYVLGNELKKFEDAWATHCDSKYCLGVGNGMDAIEIGLRALGIGRGDEVITTPMTAFATVLAIYRSGATPVLADIDANTGILSLEGVRRCITKKTKAVLVVHLYGQIGNMDVWKTFCSEMEISLLEDCAQAHSARWKGAVAGTHGAWGAYSFYPTKNLGTLGDGGALVLSQNGWAEKAERLRNYGQSKRYYHSDLGLNSRLDEIHAALLSVRLEWLNTFTKRRQDVAARYHGEISNPKIQLLAKPEDRENHVYHLFVLRCTERDALSQHLRSKGVESLIHYPVPMHLQSPCSGITCDPAGLGESERHAQVCLSIPCHPQIEDDDISKVISAINDF